ncbi:hypothetical protein R1flu_020376 [Riccia fluitans]|uniref:Biopterin transport-related protein BT1 n=1 Tax=Riccia fluitans TaxID=41844 RepID=A0ABD1ZLK3_9MARC
MLSLNNRGHRQIHNSNSKFIVPKQRREKLFNSVSLLRSDAAIVRGNFLKFCRRKVKAASAFHGRVGKKWNEREVNWLQPKRVWTVRVHGRGFVIACSQMDDRGSEKSTAERRRKVEGKVPLRHAGATTTTAANAEMAPPDSTNGSIEMVELDEERATPASKRAEMRELLPRKKRNCELFGVEMSPDTVAIAMVYFVQGILGLSRLAISFFLKDDLHLDPAETAVLIGFTSFPWLIKPIYGLISDGLPLFGYRRRSYLFLCGLLGAASWASLATFVDDKYGALISILLSSLSVAFSDVVVDSMVVERARGESQNTSGSLQSLCWGSSATGGIVSAYFSGSLVELYGVRFVFGVTAVLPLITSAVAVLVREERMSLSGIRVSDKPAAESPELSFLAHAKSQLCSLWEAVKEPSIFLPTLFIFLWQATPMSDTAMLYFTTNKLGFGPEFLGRVRLVTSVASLAGVAIYNQLLKEVPLRKMFFWTTTLGSLIGLSQIVLIKGWNRDVGISDEWFAVGDSLVGTVLGQVSFMPVLVLAARLCPPGVEATLFAALMSISNGGGVVGGVIGAWLTGLFGVTSENFDNLALLVVVCNVTSLFPLPFLGLLPSNGDVAAAVEKAESVRDVDSKAE